MKKIVTGFKPQGGKIMRLYEQERSLFTALNNCIKQYS